MTQMLAQGDTFPSMTLKIAGGEELQLPDDLNTPYTILLFYRGHW